MTRTSRLTIHPIEPAPQRRIPNGGWRQLRRHNQGNADERILTTPLLLLGVLALASLGWALLVAPHPAPARNAGDSNVLRSPQTEPTALAVLSARATQTTRDDMWIVEGRVQNVTGESLSNLQVITKAFDGSGNLIAVDRSLLDYKRLRPGEISDFRAITFAGSGISRVDLEFQSELGRSLPARDDSHGHPQDEVVANALPRIQIASADSTATTSPR